MKNQDSFDGQKSFLGHFLWLFVCLTIVLIFSMPSVLDFFSKIFPELTYSNSPRGSLSGLIKREVVKGFSASFGFAILILLAVVRWRPHRWFAANAVFFAFLFFGRDIVTSMIIFGKCNPMGPDLSSCIWSNVSEYYTDSTLDKTSFLMSLVGVLLYTGILWSDKIIKKIREKKPS